MNDDIQLLLRVGERNVWGHSIFGDIDIDINPENSDSDIIPEETREIWSYKFLDDDTALANSEVPAADVLTTVTSETAVVVDTSAVVNPDSRRRRRRARNEEDEEEDQDDNNDSDYSNTSGQEEGEGEEDDDGDDDSTLQNTQSSTTSTIPAGNKKFKKPATSITFYFVSDPKDSYCIKAGYTVNENNNTTQKRYKPNGACPVTSFIKLEMACPNAQKAYDRKFRAMMREYLYVPEDFDSKLNKIKLEHASFLSLINSDDTTFDSITLSGNVSNKELYKRYDADGNSLLPTYGGIVIMLQNMSVVELGVAGDKVIPLNLVRRSKLELPWSSDFIKEVYGRGHTQHGTKGEGGGGSLALSPPGIRELIDWMLSNKDVGSLRDVQDETSIAIYILWVGIGYAEEAILIVSFFREHYPQSQIRIMGIDIEQATVDIANSNAAFYNMSDNITVSLTSLLFIDEVWAAKQDFDLVYTSAAFDPLLSIKLFYLCSKLETDLLCSKSIIESVILVKRQYKIKSRVKNFFQDFPITQGKKNNVWYKIAKAAVDGSTENDSLQKRDIYLIKIKKFSNCADDVKIFLPSNFCNYAECIDLDRISELLKRGRWIDLLRQQFDRSKHEVNTETSNQEIIISFHGTYLSDFIDSISVSSSDWETMTSFPNNNSYHNDKYCNNKFKELLDYLYDRIMAERRFNISKIFADDIFIDDGGDKNKHDDDDDDDDDDDTSCCCGCNENAAQSEHRCSVTNKRILSWCGTVGGYGCKGPCKTCAKK